MAEWSTAYINDLPDANFLYIAPGGDKDDEGKTVPRDLRMFPYKDTDGAVDLPHLRNALARIPQSDLSADLKDRLTAKAQRILEEASPSKAAVAVKFVGKNTIEGPVFLYRSPFKDGKDVHRETFSPDTDLCEDWFGKSGRPLLYEHGLDSDHKARKVGVQAEYEKRAEGVWQQSQLDLNAKYRKAIDALIEEEALGYSGGAMPHLAQKNARTGVITRFPWVETSLTPIPANPDNLGVHWVKSALAIEHLASVDIDLPDPLKAALTALDEWADTKDDIGLPDGLKFADHADRLLADVEAFRDRSLSLVELRAKSGRVLSATTRERLMRHPASLRELADDLDALLSEADAGKSLDLSALHLDFERTLARLNGVDLPAVGEPA